MSNLYEEHINITEEVKNLIEPMKVVFPADYGRIYYNKAHDHNIVMTPEELLNREMLDEKMVRHVVSLVECTDTAIDAMEHGDIELLKSVLLKTKLLQEEIQELQKIVYEDGLTKSYNRKWFEDTVLTPDHITLRESGTLVMVDLNKFKEINDTYGHIVGDKVLKHVALKLKESGGRVIRYGGDEFIVIFDVRVTSHDIRSKMDKIIHYFQKVHFKVKPHSFKISFAYGLAPFHEGSEVSDVIEMADKAMYTHKKSEKTLTSNT